MVPFLFLENAGIFCPTPTWGTSGGGLSRERKAGVTLFTGSWTAPLVAKLSCRRFTKFSSLENQKSF